MQNFTSTPADSSTLRLLQERWRTYAELSKSGIVTLVLISVIGGYLAGFPLEHSFHLSHLLAVLLGMLLLAGGSSALNQVQEVDLDRRMKRTENRPIPSGRVSLTEAKVFAWSGIILGGALLSLLNYKLGLLGATAVLSYNGLYTLWWKRHWAFAAVPGAIPGALPILMGYTAVSDQIFTPGGIYLFGILFFWQMPHFWSLALKYKDDYADGGFPTLPVALGSASTVTQITIWCLGYIAIAGAAPLFLEVGMLYLVVALLMSAKILLELRTFAKDPEGKRAWLRFFLWVNFSLIIYVFAAVVDHWSGYVEVYFR